MIPALIYIASVLACFLCNTGRGIKAIELCKEGLVLLNNKAMEKEKHLRNFFLVHIYFTMLNVYFDCRNYKNAAEYGRKLLSILLERGETVLEGIISIALAKIYQIQHEPAEAQELYETGIKIMNKIGNRKMEKEACENLADVFQSLFKYDKAREYYEKALSITIEIGDKEGEARAYRNLGTVFESLAEYDKAKEYNEKALAIAIKIGDRKGEANAFGNIGTVFQSLAKYDKAKEYYEKALAITIEIGHKDGEARAYRNLGTVFKSLAEYDTAKEYLEKALAIAIKIGDRKGEVNAFGNIGTVFQSLAEYDKAKEYYEKARAITIEIGDKDGEARAYRSLGTVFESLAEYDTAKEYLEKGLAIAIKIGDRQGEANAFRNIGNVFKSLAQYDKAKEYYEKALAITIEIGDKREESNIYKCLGDLSLMSLVDYNKATEYLEKALAMIIEVGDKKGELCVHVTLGQVFRDLGDYDKPKEYYKKALKIAIETGDKEGESTSYLLLGSLSLDRCKYPEANENIRKALELASNIGARSLEAYCYHYLGRLFKQLGDFVKAKEHFEKAFTMAMEIGDRQVEAACYGNIGSVFTSLGKNDKAEEYLEEALSICKNIGALQMECKSSCFLATVKISQQKSQEAFPYLFESVKKSEVCRGFLKDNDEFKILYSDKNMIPLKKLSKLFCDAGNPEKAVYVEELGRARALSDLMAAKYSVESEISADPKSWTGIENVVNLESHCTCLYISYTDQNVLLWILKASGDIQYRTVTVDKKTLEAKLAKHLDEYFANIADNFRSFGILPEEKCEDRSLNGTEPKPVSSHQENLAVWRKAEDKVDPKPSLTLFYQMIIAPVTDLLKTPEIIIIPERSLFRVPFPALLDEGGKYLSETFRIRIAPSLATLKLIQDSPADYHSQTGALIVGDPDVGEVSLKGYRKTFAPLPCARNEAKMIGQWLGVKPLLGKHATKQAVLQRIHSVSLVHIAAHGNAERGEILLAPERTGGGTPHDKDYLLTMSEISKVQLRAKLVVLSCCHSAQGQIRAEGVIGIARAFLGSGARSVLVSLWALEDSATEHFMRRFYKNLMRKKSASESLHQAMKWMRDHGFSDVSEWAPFLLIGDDVTFVFENVSIVI